MHKFELFLLRKKSEKFIKIFEKIRQKYLNFNCLYLFIESAFLEKSFIILYLFINISSEN